MNLSNPKFLHLPWITIFIFMSSIIPFTLSDPRIFEAGLFCSPNRTGNSSYIPLFTNSMEILSLNVTAMLWGTASVNTTNNTIYNLAQCHSDLTRDDCLQCYAASRTRIPRCVPSVAGRIYLDGCFIRYDYYPFYNESVNDAMDTVNCTTTLGVATDSNFGENVGRLVDRLAVSAVASGRPGGYAVRGSRGVFGLAQCWNTVSSEGCRACLTKASRQVRTCLPNREGRALNTGCYMRFSTERFYSNRTGDSDNSGASRTRALAISLSVVAFCMLCLFAGYAAYRRWKKIQLARSNLGLISYSYNKSKLNFKYETLEKATNYFDDTRKLGQGGAGSVYKGTLPNGKIVAVKRLFFSTRQWVDEFFNEINLISGIEHKNLVKLLGCSIEGPESLLVYEYVANKSLEQHIFDKNMDKPLKWTERYNILVGTAEGLAYLHGGTELRIIHRDIKSSNVLLDEKLDAKIADFGLARLFAPDKTHLSTGIAGTLGYMAPEYLVKGQLTEKADVYSYGVLVLEVVCGRKNNAFAEDSGSLLQTVWKLYKTDRLTESVDPSLKGEFPVMEVSKVLKIGLLCAQASVAHRPSMVEVVQMLTDENCEIPEPNQPPFLNTGGHSASTTRSSYSINSSTSNVMTKQGASDPSSESYSIQSSDGLIRSEDFRQK